jgi:ElaB/YqjD/DUF883 family membrane-anchored ribosome-binding protein
MTTHIQDLVKPETLKEAREQLTRVSDQLEQVDQQVRKLVRERPVAMLLAAAFAGHLIGRLVSKA